MIVLDIMKGGLNLSDIKNIRMIASGASLAAMTCVATMVIKIPTPTMGYVHPGDCFVLLAGFMLGSVTGGISAGIGSMLSDLLGGYAAWAPGTFIIKFLTAYVAALVFRVLSGNNNMRLPMKAVLAGAAGEIVMITGYFLYNILVITVINSGSEAVAVGAAVTQSAAEIPFNIAQGLTGIVLAAALIPVLEKINPAAK